MRNTRHVRDFHLLWGSDLDPNRRGNSENNDGGWNPEGGRWKAEQGVNRLGHLTQPNLIVFTRTIFVFWNTQRASWTVYHRIANPWISKTLKNVSRDQLQSDTRCFSEVASGRGLAKVSDAHSAGVGSPVLHRFALLQNNSPVLSPRQRRLSELVSVAVTLKVRLGYVLEEVEADYETHTIRQFRGSWVRVCQ